MNFSLIGIGATMALSAVGSGIGAGVAGMAAIGAWKKCFAQNKPAPFMLVAFVGAPLTQTVYGFILMNALKAAIGKMDPGIDPGHRHLRRAWPWAYRPGTRAKPGPAPRTRSPRPARASATTSWSSA